MVLAEIQSKLKCPKDLYNSFGKYHYRSAEAILEAVKPLINPLGYSITTNDEIVLIGSRYYVKSVATMTNGTETYTATAYAREEEEKKGMDGSQITGAASSYARKYALNALFGIDDNKDSDSTNNGKEKKEQNAKMDVSDAVIPNLVKMLKAGSTMEQIKSYYNVTPEIEKKINAAL